MHDRPGHADALAASHAESHVVGEASRRILATGNARARAGARPLAFGLAADWIARRQS